MNRLIALMFIIGFVGFLGSVFTGSYALAGVAGGFFAGATCAMAMVLVEDRPEKAKEEKTDRNIEQKGRGERRNNEPRYIKRGMVMIPNPKFVEPEGVEDGRREEIQPDIEAIAF